MLQTESAISNYMKVSLQKGQLGKCKSLGLQLQWCMYGSRLLLFHAKRLEDRGIFIIPHSKPHFDGEMKQINQVKMLDQIIGKLKHCF